MCFHVPAISCKASPDPSSPSAPPHRRIIQRTMRARDGIGRYKGRSSAAPRSGSEKKKKREKDIRKPTASRLRLLGASKVTTPVATRYPNHRPRKPRPLSTQEGTHHTLQGRKHTAHTAQRPTVQVSIDVHRTAPHRTRNCQEEKKTHATSPKQNQTTPRHLPEPQAPCPRAPGDPSARPPSAASQLGRGSNMCGCSCSRALTRPDLREPIRVQKRGGRRDTRRRGAGTRCPFIDGRARGFMLVISFRCWGAAVLYEGREGSAGWVRRAAEAAEQEEALRGKGKGGKSAPLGSRYKEDVPR